MNQQPATDEVAEALTEADRLVTKAVEAIRAGHRIECKRLASRITKLRITMTPMRIASGNENLAIRESLRELALWRQRLDTCVSRAYEVPAFSPAPNGSTAA